MTKGTGLGVQAPSVGLEMGVEFERDSASTRAGVASLKRATFSRKIPAIVTVVAGVPAMHLGASGLIPHTSDPSLESLDSRDS